MTNENSSRHLRLTFAILVLIAGCASSSLAKPQIEYRVAVIADDSLGVAADECEVEDSETLSYRYPSGREVVVHAAREPALTVPLDEATDILLVDLTDSRSPGMRAVVVDLFPPAPVFKHAMEVRRSLARCDLLLTLNGKPIGLERRGTDWSRRVPGGTFPSVEAAKQTLSEAAGSLRSEVPTEAEIGEEDDYWEWRRAKDLWDFHCDSMFREVIRTRDPALYDVLSKTPPPDCQHPPVLRNVETAD